MKYKLIAIDLDGTLVNKRNKISKRNIEALSKYISNGGIVSFITGRSINSAKYIADLFFKYSNKKIHYICSLNGSYIYDNINQTNIELNYINNHVMDNIVEILNKNNVSFGIYNQESIKKNELWIYNIPKILKIIPFNNKHNRVVSIPKTNNISNVFKINIVRLLSKNKFNNIFNLLKKVEGINISHTTSYMLEITSLNIDKAYALKKICALTNINLSETLTIGDSGNDISMFKISGLSCAVNDKKIKKHHFKPNIVLNTKIDIAVSYIIYNYIFKD